MATKKNEKKATNSLEDRFQSIASTAILDAELIECSLEEFLEGLKTMASELNSRVEQVTDELRAKNR